MKNLIITKKDLDKDNYYKEDSIDFDGNIIIEEKLGYVRFKKSVKSNFNIIAEAGSGIKAGLGIKAGEGIVTFYKGGIISKSISCLRISVGFNIKEEQTIQAKIIKGKVILGKVIK